MPNQHMTYHKNEYIRKECIICSFILTLQKRTRNDEKEGITKERNRNINVGLSYFSLDDAT